MPALKESSASLSAAMQLPLNDSDGDGVVFAPETAGGGEEAATVGARKKSRRHMAAAATPWKEDRGVAAIVALGSSWMDGSACRAVPDEKLAMHLWGV